MATDGSPQPQADGSGARRFPIAVPRALGSLSFRDLALASLLGAGISGLVLHGSYDPQAAARSIAEWLLGQPGLVLIRNLHYWSAQSFVVSSAVVLWRRLHPTAFPPVGRMYRVGLISSVPVIAFLIASGFLLRGDADARSFQPLCADLITELPFVGPLLAARLFSNETIQPVLLQAHVAAAAFAMLLTIAAWWYRPYPAAARVALFVAGIAVVSLVVSPGLNDGLDHRSSGPWLFAGIEAVLRWIHAPLLPVALGFAMLWLWWALPRFRPRGALGTQRCLLGGVALYLALIGAGLRIESSDTLQSSWPNGRGDWRLGSIVPPRTGTLGLTVEKIPVVLGRPEGCLVCHPNHTGLGNSHRPEVIGCAACHLGDTTSLDLDRAHFAMVRIPGNLADAPRTCGSAGCHVEIVPRVERSIMATFSGVIDVNRRVFGEPVDPSAPPPHVRQLGHSASDSHLRQLCVSCHLGQEKDTFGPIVQQSRGGGCNACHLVYSPAATQALERFEAMPFGGRKEVPTAHPSLSLNPENGHCFGCHSRSGRISTNYEGWHELREPPPAAELNRSVASSVPQFRLLDDGRYFTRVTPDVHQTRGMDCIDCHTSSEVMGGAKAVRRKSEQVQVRCEDCHARAHKTLPASALDAESLKLIGLRQWQLHPGQRLGTTRAGGALINVVVEPDGGAHLRRKRTGANSALRPPLDTCDASPAHRRLSCSSCHTPWAPRCASCHTAFDPRRDGFDHLAQSETRGTWIEKSGAFEVAPPTLGIRLDATGAALSKGIVDTFVPGMILELDRNRSAGAPPDAIFRRLYAHTAPHTTSRAARSCESCHQDPVALGYGRGELRFEILDGVGRWRFDPAHSVLPQDGLPADAWTGFMQTRQGMVSTRDDVRPLNVEEQRRILNVGACLTCHAGDSTVMLQSLNDPEAIYARRRASCISPEWTTAPSERR